MTASANIPTPNKSSFHHTDDYAQAICDALTTPTSTAIIVERDMIDTGERKIVFAPLDATALTYEVTIRPIYNDRPKTVVAQPLPPLDPCYAKLVPGEPFFVLRGQDVFAPALVRMWAEKVVLAGPVDKEKIGIALATADAMEAWPNRKIPD